MSQQHTIKTRVGLAVHGDNMFRGHSVRHELVGARSFWQMLSLSLGGPELTAFQCEALDAMTSSATAADPRIWPLKVTRVAGAYGGMWSALCSTFIMGDGSSVGCNPCGPAAVCFQRIQELLEEQGEDTDIAGVLEQVRLEQGGRWAGFGVPGRAEDERFLAVNEWFEQHCPENYPTTYWNVLQRMRPIMIDSYALQLNLVTCVTALLLDMGFDASQVVVMAFFTVMPCYIANAYEATSEPESMLPQRMIPSAVRYVGKSSSAVAPEEAVDF